MKSPGPTRLQSVIRILRPLLILGGVVVYALGAGIARYLGAGVDWSAYILGQAWVISMQLATFLLIEYQHKQDTLPPSNRHHPNLAPHGGEGAIPRRSVLLAAFTSMAVMASLTVIVIAQVKPGPLVVLMMLVGFLGGLFYSTPLARGGTSLEASGYGELAAAFLMGYLIPAFSFVLQAGDLHRLLSMATIPLVAICLAMFIALETSSYAADLKSGQCTLMVRMGWKSAMNLHNTLIFSAYLLVGLASFFGQPRFAVLAALFSLPVGMLQFWQMWRLSQGARPNWMAIRINAIATFGLMAYLLTYSYWTH
jgi:1,4-dihydroxy-2-naphthoate octaprenyltransferase